MPMFDAAPPTVGSVLGGRYRLDQVVGRGGMADVYRATDDLLGRTVAVKLMRAGADSDGERLRIEAEMRTLARLRHPGLVTLFDAGAGDETSGGAPYLVMDFIAGPTLRQRTSTGALSPTEVAALGHDVAEALRYVHHNGVVHRDVKPANILLDPTETGTAAARLTDFGIAQVAEHTRHTVQGTTVGTANYLSPEQARGLTMTAASDTYSFGLVLLEALTGRLAFPGVGVEAALARLHRDPDVPSYLDPRWQGLLRAVTAQHPDDRPDDAWVTQRLAELAGRPMQPLDPATVALTSNPQAHTRTLAAAPGQTTVLAAAPAGDTALLEPVPEQRRTRRGAAWLLGGAAAAVVLGLVLAVVLLGSGSGSGPQAAPGARSTPSSRAPGATSSTAGSSTAGSSSAAPRTSPVTYTDVDGRLGHDLRRFESAVRSGGSGSNTVRTDLQRLARAAAAGKYSSARRILTQLEGDVAQATRSGAMSQDRSARLTSIARSLAADLRSLTASKAGQSEKTTGPAAPAGPGQGKQKAPGQQKKPGGPPGAPGGP